jgi:hypothetical protein
VVRDLCHRIFEAFDINFFFSNHTAQQQQRKTSPNTTQPEQFTLGLNRPAPEKNILNLLREKPPCLAIIPIS